MSFVPYWKLPLADRVLPDQVSTYTKRNTHKAHTQKATHTKHTPKTIQTDVRTFECSDPQVEFKRNMRLLNDVLNKLIAKAVETSEKADVEELTFRYVDRV